MLFTEQYKPKSATYLSCLFVKFFNMYI